MKKLALMSFVVLASLSSAQITRQGSGYLFRMKFVTGQVMKYSVVSTMGGINAGGKPMEISLPMVWKVASVAGGIATVDTTVGPVTVGKQTMMQPTKNRVQISSQGKVVGNTGVGQQVAPSLPTGPVKIGQSWSSSSAISTGMGPAQDVKATYTFKGLRSIGGKQVAELSVLTTGQASGKGAMFLLVSDGSLFQSRLAMDLKVQSPDGKGVTYKVTANIDRK